MEKDFEEIKFPKSFADIKKFFEDYDKKLF